MISWKTCGRFLNTPDVIIAIRRQSGQDQNQARNRNDQQIFVHDISPYIFPFSLAEASSPPLARLSAANTSELLAFRHV